MAWEEVSVMDLRREFVRLAALEGSNRRELCRRFGISATTGYKWLRRFEAGEDSGADRSRRPKSNPLRTACAQEASILAVRDAHPAWGARKIAAVLARAGEAAPATSTIHAVLVRHGRIVLPQGGAPATLRFEMEAPNLLWQMDFKGSRLLTGGTRLHPLTIIDDHSRFALALEACADECLPTVRARLERVFSHYGLPQAFFVDNGTPWGDCGSGGWTRLRVWLLKLGVRLIYSRPYHPQGRGKNERFHRSLEAELFNLNPLRDFAEAQTAFDRWRDVYNHERPHGALGHDVPASHYHASPRAMPDTLPEPEYDPDDIVRRVPKTKGYVSFKGKLWRVPDAFQGERLAIRPLKPDGTYGVFFASQPITTIDLTKGRAVNHVSEQVSTMSPG